MGSEERYFLLSIFDVRVLQFYACGVSIAHIECFNTAHQRVRMSSIATQAFVDEMKYI